MRLDQPDEDAAEQVGPAVVGGHAQAPGHHRVGERVAVGRAVRRNGGEQVDGGEAVECLGQGQPLEGGERVGLAAAEAQPFCPGGLGSEREQRGAIGHQRIVGLTGAVPFEHRELGMVQGAALAVAKDAGEAEEARLARGQQLLAGEFRRGVQVERLAASVGQDRLGGEGGEMRLVARRDLQRGGLHLHEVVACEMPAQGREDAVAGQEQGPAIRVDAGVPPGRGFGAHANGASRWQRSRG